MNVTINKIKGKSKRVNLTSWSGFRDNVDLTVITNYNDEIIYNMSIIEATELVKTLQLQINYIKYQSS